MKLYLKGKSPIFIEIADEYKKYIMLEIFKYGEKLPSVRVLASELGINPNTVNKSYQLLEEEGYIKTYPKKGAYVSYIVDKEKERFEFWKEQIKELKNNGLTKEIIKKIVQELYGGCEND